jgi:integrase
MSVQVRPYRKGGWEVDIVIRLDNGQTFRERRKSPVASKSGSLRWGQDRERHILKHGPEPKVTSPTLEEPATPTPTKAEGKPNTGREVPTLAEFAPRYIEGYARANREKPSSIDSKESILRNHLLPALGKARLDELHQEDIQRLKGKLGKLSNKTVNNILTVLNTLLACAVEWEVIKSSPVRIRLLKVLQSRFEFYDFHEYERLAAAAAKADARSSLVVLLGGEAGLRRGEMMALEWTSIDFQRRLLTVERSEWKGHVTSPKGNKIRTVPMTSRLTRALQNHRHLRGSRVLLQDDGATATAKLIRTWLLSGQRLANLRDKGPHTLRHTFCSHLAMRGVPARAIQELAGHVHLTTTQRYMHLTPAALESAIRMLEQPPPAGHEAPRPVDQSLRFGDILETGRD